jgi:hypothetical protein
LASAIGGLTVPFVGESSEEKLAAYRASIERLTQANVGLHAEQRRMKWVAIVTLAASVATYFAYSHLAGAFVLIVGGSAFFVGHYVVYMHLYENRLTIKSAKQMIASLESS